MNILNALMEEREINSERCCGSITRDSFEELVKHQITLEKNILEMRKCLQEIWANSGLGNGCRPIGKPADIGISIRISESVLWIDLPVVLPHIKELSNNAFLTDAIYYEMHRLDPVAISLIKQTLKGGYVIVFEFLNDLNINVKNKDVDNAECISIVNAVTTSLCVSDDPTMMSMYKTTKPDDHSGTRVGVMNQKSFQKYLMIEA